MLHVAVAVAIADVAGRFTNQFCPLCCPTLCGRCPYGKGNSKIYPCVCVCVCAWQLFYMLFPNRTMRLLTVFQRCRMNRTQRGSCLKNMPSRFRTAVSCIHGTMYCTVPRRMELHLGLYPAVIAGLGIWTISSNNFGVALCIYLKIYIYPLMTKSSLFLVFSIFKRFHF